MTETMSVEEYPEDIEIKKTNFKTDQQEAAAETIAEEWPVDLDTLAEEGQHVKVFYSQVLDQFLGPEDAEMTFGEIESEYGSVEQWAERDEADETEPDVDVPDVEEIDPGGASENGTSDDEEDAGSVADGDGAESTASGSGATASGTASADGSVAAAMAEAPAELDGEAVDERRRAWFAAGFREGVAFALRNPDLVADRSEE
jgi:hypothetical protein